MLSVHSRESAVHSQAQPVLWSVVCGLWTLCLLAGSGCGPPANPEQLRKEVLKADPGFAEVLAKRDEQANRIALLERELALKRNQVERQIVQLRNELKAVSTQANEKMQKIQLLIKPDQDRLALAQNLAIQERRAKQAQRSSLGSSISQLRKSLAQTTPPWPAEERAKMERDLQELMKETERVDRELDGLAQHIRLLKTKRILLRL